MTRRIAFISLLLFAAAATAEEALQTILDRGFVSSWLVCGPFESDVDGGIVTAVESGKPPIGDKDFLLSAGGVARIKPEHLSKVPKEDGTAFWEETTQTSPTLDLAPFFPDKSEGVAYAAFYVQAAQAQEVYFDLHTALGARVYINGFPLRDLRPTPIALAGLDRFIAPLRAGRNLVILQVPGAAYSSLADAAGLPLQEFMRTLYQNKPLLSGKSGFEIALRLAPMARLDGLAYIPKLESTGTFSGHGAKLQQDVRITLFNPQTTPSAPLTLKAEFPRILEPLRRTIPALSPEGQFQTTLPVPIGTAVPGTDFPVDVTFEAGDQTATFSGSVKVLPPPPPGAVYVLTGAYQRQHKPQSQAEETKVRIASLERQAAMLVEEPAYGFDLGNTEDWRPWLSLEPDQRGVIQEAALASRCAAHAAFTTPDERIVSGELLARNLAYGHYSSESLLGVPGSCYIAWNSPAIAPQTPQLLADASLAGLVSNTPVPGVSELFWHQALDGSNILHRRKRSGDAPPTVEAFQKTLWLQRRELLDQGLSTDLYVNESLGMPPEPFFLGAATSLRKAWPSIILSGNGAHEFFRAAQEALQQRTVPVTTRPMNAYQRGVLLIQPDIKRAHGLCENLLLTAEKCATLAAMLGAQYPDRTLDRAWRQLLFWSRPDRLGFAQNTRTAVDVLAAQRETAGLARATLNASLAYIATQTNTYREPLAEAKATIALVVFNPSSWPRTDAVTAYVPLEKASGITLLDGDARRLPFSAENLKVTNAQLMGAELRFLATDVPPLGYKTYYVAPTGTVPTPVAERGAQIENDFFTLRVDEARGGAIVSLIDKRTKQQLAPGLLNDFVALDEDVTKNDGGRDLWTTGSLVKASSQSAKVRVTRAKWMQKLTITTSMDDGDVVREIALYQSMPHIDFTIRLEGLARKDRIYALTFATDADGCVPVFGERYGALVGRKSQGVLDYRTQGPDNPSYTSAHPALRWTALSPGDHFLFGKDTSVPLGPCAVVYGTDGLFREEARTLQRAFMGRAIPCATWPDKTRRLNPIWTDSTEFANHNDDLNHGTAMRIILGGPEYNVFTRRVFSQLPSKLLTEFNDRMIGGAALFFYDRDVPSDASPVPTLIIAAHTVDATREFTQSIAHALAGTGIIVLPPEAYVPLEGATQPRGGMALLHQGAALTSVEGDGALALLLAHGGQLDDGQADAMAGTTQMHYALYPFNGTWRGARIPQKAHAFNEPLVASTTNLHSGHLPPEHSFVQVSPDNFIVTALKAGGYRKPAMRGDPAHPRNGLVLRGYDSLGREMGMTVALTAGIRSALDSNVLDNQGSPMGHNGERTVFSTAPFGIKTLWIQPSLGFQRGDGQSLDFPPQTLGPAFTRYWRHNAGPTPLGGLPLTIAIEEPLTLAKATVPVRVTNNLTDKAIQGVVTIEAPATWHVSPDTFSYDLSPGASAMQEILVLRPQGIEDKGGLLARTNYEGVTLLDVELLNPNPLTMDVERMGQDITVVLTNTSSLRATGALELVAPIGYWTEWLTSHPVHVTPARSLVNIPPFGQQRLVFYVVGDIPKGLMTVKLTANGQVLYQRVEQTTGLATEEL